MGLFARLKDDVFNAFVSIMKGHDITWRNMWRERQTLQYPNERPVLPERYRGIPGVHPDLCIVCGACAKACPAQVISIEGRKIAGTKHRELTRYTLEAGRCMFCGLCEEACPTKPVKAVRMSDAYELSSGNKGSLIYEINDLKAIWHTKPVGIPEEEYLASTPRKLAERDLAAAASGEAPAKPAPKRPKAEDGADAAAAKPAPAAKAPATDAPAGDAAPPKPAAAPADDATPAKEKAS